MLFPVISNDSKFWQEVDFEPLRPPVREKNFPIRSEKFTTKFGSIPKNRSFGRKRGVFGILAAVAPLVQSRSGYSAQNEAQEMGFHEYKSVCLYLV